MAYIRSSPVRLQHRDGRPSRKGHTPARIPSTSKRVASQPVVRDRMSAAAGEEVEERLEALFEKDDRT